VVGADRTEKEHQDLIDQGKTKTEYDKSQHGEKQGYKAADVKYYDKKGKQINPKDVADKANEMKSIGGIGIYNSFTHIDIGIENPMVKLQLGTTEQSKNMYTFFIIKIYIF